MADNYSRQTKPVLRFEVRFGDGPWKVVDLAGFRDWLANVQNSGCGTARRAM